MDHCGSKSLLKTKILSCFEKIKNTTCWSILINCNNWKMTELFCCYKDICLMVKDLIINFKCSH